MKEADHLEKFIQNFENEERYVLLLLIAEVQGKNIVFPALRQIKGGQDPVQMF